MDIRDIKAGGLPTLLRSEGIFTKREYSQCFLINHGILEKMVTAIKPVDRNIVEIGPGPGLLTSMLAEEARKVVAFELDEGLKKFHKKYVNSEKIEFIYGDFLKQKLKNMFQGEEWTIVGNIPYSITGLIFRKVFYPHSGLNEIFLLVQEEVARRIVGKTPREYGIPAILAWAFGNAEIVFGVNSGSFWPAPKVKSAFIRIRRVERGISVEDWESIVKFVKVAFGTRRKTLLNSLKIVYKKYPNHSIILENLKNRMVELGLSEGVRPERVSPEEFLILSREVGNLINEG
jgi:16S rRNA (adenine1518-N6/adenine1519-N6)-dimethyltransferase